MTARPPRRSLIIVADDFGIGPAVSKGILELAREGFLDAGALLVNSPYAAESVKAWDAAGRPIPLGLHLSLTIDRPICSPGSVPSLVDGDGAFLTLSKFHVRLALGRISSGELQREFAAQWDRFIELVGDPPALVNGHHHVHGLRLPARVLVGLLEHRGHRAYVRRVKEPWRALVRAPGSTVKRFFLRWACAGNRTFDAAGLPGNDVLLGLADPRRAAQLDYLTRWFVSPRGRVLELMVHPGRSDETLLGRDGKDASLLAAREEEMHRLRDPSLAGMLDRLGLSTRGPLGNRSRGGSASGRTSPSSQ